MSESASDDKIFRDATGYRFDQYCAYSSNIERPFGINVRVKQTVWVNSDGSRKESDPYQWNRATLVPEDFANMEGTDPCDPKLCPPDNVGFWVKDQKIAEALEEEGLIVISRPVGHPEGTVHPTDKNVSQAVHATLPKAKLQNPDVAAYLAAKRRPADRNLRPQWRKAEENSRFDLIFAKVELKLSPVSKPPPSPKTVEGAPPDRDRSAAAAGPTTVNGNNLQQYYVQSVQKRNESRNERLADLATRAESRAITPEQFESNLARFLNNPQSTAYFHTSSAPDGNVVFDCWAKPQNAAGARAEVTSSSVVADAGSSPSPTRIAAAQAALTLSPEVAETLALWLEAYSKSPYPDKPNERRFDAVNGKDAMTAYIDNGKVRLVAQDHTAIDPVECQFFDATYLAESLAYQARESRRLVATQDHLQLRSAQR